MNTIKLPEVAKKVYYPCKKCECDRYQVVISHTGPTGARLECEVCKTKNLFKLVEPKRPKTSAVPKKKPSKAKGATHSAKWSQLRDSNSEKPTAYNMKKGFEVGAALEHPKFGLGFVVDASGQAIQVLFEDEPRQLVHNRV